MSHFDGNNYFESVDEWEIRELTLPTGEKFIGVYIRSGKKEHRFALGGHEPQGWLKPSWPPQMPKLQNKQSGRLTSNAPHKRAA